MTTSSTPQRHTPPPEPDSARAADSGHSGGGSAAGCGERTTAALGASLLGALLLVCVGTLISPRVGLPMAFAAYLGAFIPYGLGLRWWARGRIAPCLKSVVLWAVAFRVAMLSSAPRFSDDIWRYVWDGHVQTQGLNPYQYAPADPALVELHTAIHPLINHPEVPTIYPPAAQLVFAFVALLGGGVFGLRLVMIAAEALTLYGLWRLTDPRAAPLDASTERASGATTDPDRARRRAWVAMALLWNPLMVVEFAGSGHLDMLAIAPLVWSLALIDTPLWFDRSRTPGDRAPRPEVEQDDPDGLGDRVPTSWRRWAWSGLCLGVSINVKLLGLGLLPVLAAWAWWPRRWPGRWAPAGAVKRVAALLIGVALALGATSAPYSTPWVFGQSGSPAKGLRAYVSQWRANDSLFALVAAGESAALSLAPGADRAEDRPWWRFDSLAKPFEALGITQQWEGREVPSTTFSRIQMEQTVAKAIMALVLAMLMALVLLHRYGPSASALVMLTAVLLVAPTVHPWYVAWLVPLAVAHRARSVLLWSALVVMAYTAALNAAFTGLYADSIVGRAIEYVPVYVVLIWEAGRRAAGQHPPVGWGRAPRQA